MEFTTDTWIVIAYFIGCIVAGSIAAIERNKKFRHWNEIDNQTVATMIVFSWVGLLIWLVLIIFKFLKDLIEYYLS